ncbi:hypothetical protein L596_030038 [Steinernema carpocapsae]|uniref:Uncharacterized protein n=1 Tax=Steinernema carpocapsae TaxID=34508 RepID=A0A4U5LRJ6_STECR|nr:hypothetical protein L596_030038 [Steinernema carpocapsae]
MQSNLLPRLHKIFSYRRRTLEPRRRCAKIAEVVFEALNASNCTFKRMVMGYYGALSEEFVAQQIERNIEKLELIGPWPNGAIHLITMYLNRCDNASITLTSHKVSVTQNLFDLLFAKFLECKLYLKYMQGSLDFDPDYLHSLRPDLQVKLKKDEGKNMLTWKSLIDCRDFFQVKFLGDEVEIFTHNMGLCICGKDHSMG